jgi:hypothetical protein
MQRVWLILSLGIIIVRGSAAKYGYLEDKTSFTASSPPENGTRTISIQQSPHAPIASKVLLTAEWIGEQKGQLFRNGGHLVSRDGELGAQLIWIRLQDG